MGPIWRGVQTMPLVARFVVGGIIVFGVAGAILGLILGLIAYPPTAWAAVVELAVPGVLVGALLGLIGGAAVQTVRRARTPR
ncbi:hypothetical protein GCM10022240_24460 [Microbacterium kribbense]|uniref:Major facilitator superfamily (MFS) profile domain-containing protein n=1 Tax=Microbacterium kribbense TaxID=433645 RepID=A0ABP7GRH1_9MICO